MEDDWTDYIWERFKGDKIILSSKELWQNYNLQCGITMCTGEVQINDNIYRSKVIKMVKTESEDFFI